MIKIEYVYNFFSKRAIISIVSICIILITACTPQKRYQVLSFFFDGVPDPSLISEVKTDSVSVDTQNELELVQEEKKPGMFFHDPYKEQRCGDCHNQKSMGEYIKPQPDLCYQCHDDFSKKYSYLHGPVSGGFCSDCHNSHKSKNEYLLLSSDQELCFKCHDKSITNENGFHSEVENTNCTECHNPHGGDKKTMVTGTGCYKCHDDFKTKYNYLHGPVASNYCSTCHSSHDSETENLLLREGQQLCLYCHSESLVFSNETHKDIGDYNCTECHNPHGGEDKNIFN